ncbi:hypothetical protein L1987_34009 [Smallanthus sonchifolius]|uniref:Uncharacterized protein n=1 Tax=Smallanthus sonchifolius TaxID=185202 RepID=A0ACB9HU47_9ASTR|nr:hypothetical protein L1987_34009 [Smallanthus sonchifolius]
MLPVNLAKFDTDGNPCSRYKGKMPQQKHASKSQQFQDPIPDAGVNGYKPYREALLKNQTRHNPSIDVSVPDDADFDAIQWKRPRIESRGEDPFDLHQFIDGSLPPIISSSNPLLVHNPCEITRPTPLPDLNSQLNSSHLDEAVFSSSCGSSHDSGEQTDMGGRIRNEISLEEVEATIKMGKELGVNLDNLEELVTSMIEGELESDMVQ